MNFTPLVTLLSIALLFILFFWCYRDYQIDAFRQRLFALRDDLFDHAANGQIPFDDPAYRMLRRTTNGLIRFAHQISLLQLILIFLVSKHKNTHPDFLDRLQRHTTSLNQDQQGLVRHYLTDMNRLTSRHLILSSPITCLVIGILLIPLMAMMLSVRRRLDHAKAATMERLDAMALVEGNDCVESVQRRYAEHAC